ncbi:ketopantoate reductase-like protein [Mycena sp. CBHHK59/15]|nr:ketopantoate reductase-like protein [Mycena sp. CBHHK59/15]
MRFHVLGIGPIGSLVSHHLRRALSPDHSIILLYNLPRNALHAPRAFHVETDGLLTTSTGFTAETFYDYGRLHISKEERATHPETSIESLFVTSRAPATLHAVRKLAPRLSANSTIVLIQNGLGVYDQLVENVFRDPQQRPHFIFASSSHAMFVSKTSVRGPRLVHPTVGDIEFSIVPDPLGRDFEAGFLDESLHPSERRPRLSDLAKPAGDPSFQRYRTLRNTVSALLLAEPLNARWKSMAHVQLALRRKLAVTSVIHPLSAILGCRNGDIFSIPPALRLAQRICQEASDVFGVQIREETKAWMVANGPEMRGALGAARLPRSLEQASLVSECMRVAEASKGAISNMLSAVRHGRRTEIDYLNGYLLKLGKSYGVPMPANATLYNLVRMRAAVPTDLMF